MVSKNDILLMFDLDGTLFRTKSTSVPAVQDTLSEMNLPYAEKEKIISLLGETTEEFCEELMDGNEERLDEFMKLFWKYEKKYIDEKGEFFEGSRDLIKELYSSGYLLAICSNGSKDYIDYVLKNGGLFDYFDVILSASSYTKKVIAYEEILEQSKHRLAIIIGDKDHDFKAAEELGVVSIGVEYGYGYSHELENADYLVKNAEEIYDVIEKVVKHEEGD